MLWFEILGLALLKISILSTMPDHILEFFSLRQTIFYIAFFSHFYPLLQNISAKEITKVIIDFTIACFVIVNIGSLYFFSFLMELACFGGHIVPFFGIFITC